MNEITDKIMLKTSENAVSTNNRTRNSCVSKNDQKEN